MTTIAHALVGVLAGIATVTCYVIGRTLWSEYQAESRIRRLQQRGLL
jgi:hypothetical protein